MANISGTPGNDTLFGSAGAVNDIIEGLDGNDIIFGLDGDDQLFGGAGDDTLQGTQGEDALYGGTGIDTADYTGFVGVAVNLNSGIGSGGDAQGDVLFGIENVTGSGAADSLIGDAFVNVLVGLSGIDFINGGGGNDSLYGGAHGDRLEGFTGDDKLGGGTGDDSLYGGEGNDTLEGDEGDDTLDGGLDGDILSGGAGNDTAFGGAGDDAFKGFAGADRLYGGDGFDYADYSESAAGVVVSLATGTGSGGDAEGDILSGIEAIVGSKSADTLSGDDGSNFLLGFDGDDRLNGFGGADSLSGLEGKDALDGGRGADFMQGGDGGDLYVVDDGGDVVDEEFADGIDVVTASVSFSLANKDQAEGDIENLVLVDDADIDGTGNGLANQITGNSGANVLKGGGGNDLIFAGEGNDTLDGGLGADAMAGDLGNDLYVVDNAADVVDETGGNGVDTIRSSIGFNLSDAAHVKGTVENLELAGTGNINGTGNGLANRMIGNAGANALTGSGGDDEIHGAAGNDTVNGGVGKDFLTGGTGADAFVFDVGFGQGVDHIADFRRKEGDRIYFDDAVFGKLKHGDLKKSSFEIGERAESKKDRVIYDKEDGVVRYDDDGNGKHKAKIVAILDDAANLKVGDFIVI